jgi:hypothetical protein
VVYGQFLYTSSILIGWYWLWVIPILIVAYYGAYLVSFRLTGTKAAAASCVVALFFLFIAFIYANNMSLMLRPEVFLEKYLASPNGWSLNLDDSTLVPRYLHMIVGAMAVTGLFLALFGLTKWRESHEFGSWASHRGLLLFVGATVLNLVFGTWFLLSYSRDSLLRFMREQPLGTSALAVGIVFGLASLGSAALALQVQRRLPLIIGSSATLLITLFAMVVLRDRMRRSLIGESLFPAGWIDAQWGAIILFLLLLTMALAVIGWMVREFCRRPDS